MNVNLISERKFDRYQVKTITDSSSLYLLDQNWFAIGKTPRPMVKESSEVMFPNVGLPSINYNYAFCKVSYVYPNSNKVIFRSGSLLLIQNQFSIFFNRVFISNLAGELS